MDSEIVKKLLALIPSLYLVFNAVVYIMGAILIYIAMLQARTVSLGRSQKTIAAPITTFCVGILLIYLPTTIGMMSGTLFGGGYSILAYAPPPSNANFQQLLLRAVEVVGAVGLVKGLLTAKSVGDGNAREGGTGRALTFVLGGVAALNITTLAPMLAQLVGLDVKWAFN